ncbi:hypothetical protein Mal65_41520 [Crateriforma conspicua]|nr:hypothetical protein Mal65_41520 [Crateriforma conspicua]
MRVFPWWVRLLVHVRQSRQSGSTDESECPWAAPAVYTDSWSSGYTVWMARHDIASLTNFPAFTVPHPTNDRPDG